MLGMEVWRHEMAISKGGPQVPGDAKPFQHLPWPDSQSQQLGTAEIQRGKGTAQPWDQEGADTTLQDTPPTPRQSLERS